MNETAFTAVVLDERVADEGEEVGILTVGLAERQRSILVGMEPGTPLGYIPLASVAAMVGMTKKQTRTHVLRNGGAIGRKRNGVVQYVARVECERLWPAKFPKE